MTAPHIVDPARLLDQALSDWISDTHDWERVQAFAEYGDDVPAEVEADYHRFTMPTGTHWRGVTPGGCCCAAGGNHWPDQRPPTSARPRPARPTRRSRASRRCAIRTVPASPVAGSKQL